MDEWLNISRRSRVKAFSYTRSWLLFRAASGVGIAGRCWLKCSAIKVLQDGVKADSTSVALP